MSAESGRVVAVNSCWPGRCRIFRHFRGWQRPLENGWRMEKKNRRALFSYDWAGIWDHAPIDPPVAGSWRPILATPCPWAALGYNPHSG